MRRHFFLIPILFFLVSCKSQENKKDSLRLKPAFTNITACIFSEITYCTNPQQQLDKHLPGWKIVWNASPVSGNYAFVATDGEIYTIAFRGSIIAFTEEAFNNWIYHDMNVAVQDSWPYSDIAKTRISQGSYIGWQNLEKMKDRSSGETLWGFLSKNIKKETPLVLTGHSLGGTLATVYASYIWWKFREDKKQNDNINVITFATPAPGNKAFAEDFDKKFLQSVRIENSNDIVPKFPCSKRIAKLSSLFSPTLSAADITIGYKNITTNLGNAFTMISTALDLMEFRSDFYGYSHTNGDGNLITIPISGKNTINNLAGWFAEAGYQHGIERYAAALGAPVIPCN